MQYGYARVSTADQNLIRQTTEFLNFGISPNRIYSDKESGKNFDRTQYQKLIKKLKPGDLLVIKSIDRLGRNYKAIIEEWSHITGTIGANIVVLDMPLLDTRTKNGNLVDKFIADIVLQVLSFVAENERANIRARQAEGIAIAKKSGVPFGRPKKKPSSDFFDTAKEYAKKAISLDEALDRTNMKRSNFYYYYKNCEFHFDQT